MKIYRQPDGRCNVSGIQIKALREARFLSQEQLAAKAQLAGLNITQKAISRIETCLLYTSPVWRIKSICRILWSGRRAGWPAAKTRWPG